MNDLDAQFQHALASLAERGPGGGAASESLSIAARWREGDRRQARRYVFPVRVWLQSADRETPCRVLDISAGGVRLARPAVVSLYPGDRVRVRITSCDPIAATVANTDSHSMGLRFDDRQAQANVVLSDLLRRAAAKRLEMLLHVSALAAELQDAPLDDVSAIVQRHLMSAHATYAGVLDWQGTTHAWRTGTGIATAPEAVSHHGPPHALVARLAPLPEVRPRTRSPGGVTVAEASAPVIRDGRRWGGAFMGFAMADSDGEGLRSAREPETAYLS